MREYKRPAKDAVRENRRRYAERVANFRPGMKDRIRQQTYKRVKAHRSSKN